MVQSAYLCDIFPKENTGGVSRGKSGRKMECKHCGALLSDEDAVCPVCGEAVEQEQTEQIAEQILETEENAGTEQIAESDETTGEAFEKTVKFAPAEKKKIPGWAIGVIAVLAAAIVVLVILLVAGNRNKTAETAAPAEDLAQASETELLGTGVPEGTVSYTIAPEDYTDEIRQAVVAECGGTKLTNAELAYYYWGQYYSLASTYGAYLSYMLDTETGFDQQMYDDTKTFQQAFLEVSLNMFHGVAALNADAAANGFKLDAETEDSLEQTEASLSENASLYGYETADAYLESAFGTGATLAGYMDFSRLTMTASGYLEKLTNEVAFTDAEIEAYFDENAENYASSGITKLDRPNVNVRHILVKPAETDENGEYTEAAWTEAEQKMNDILAEWEGGELTEERFSELVQQYSEDGNASTGGLYEDVHPGQMVQEFNDWCFDEAREVGNYGIVKTTYGYHLIYFSGVGETIYWREAAKTDFLNAKSNEIETSVQEKYAITTTLDNVKIVDVLAMQAAAQAAAEAAAEAAQPAVETTEQS